MTREEILAYSKGYYRGSQGRWHIHRPPMPPATLARRLMETSLALRDAVDAQLAVFDPEDEIVLLLGPLVDDVDDAMTEIGEWLRVPDVSVRS